MYVHAHIHLYQDIAGGHSQARQSASVLCLGLAIIALCSESMLHSRMYLHRHFSYIAYAYAVSSIIACVSSILPACLLQIYTRPGYTFLLHIQCMLCALRDTCHRIFAAFTSEELHHVLLGAVSVVDQARPPSKAWLAVLLSRDPSLQIC